MPAAGPAARQTEAPALAAGCAVPLGRRSLALRAWGACSAGAAQRCVRPSLRTCGGDGGFSSSIRGPVNSACWFLSAGPSSLSLQTPCERRAPPSACVCVCAASMHTPVWGSQLSEVLRLRHGGSGAACGRGTCLPLASGWGLRRGTRGQGLLVLPASRKASAQLSPLLASASDSTRRRNRPVPGRALWGVRGGRPPSLFTASWLSRDTLSFRKYVPFV